MCREASFVLTKDKVYWSNTTDSYEEIIGEFKLLSYGARGEEILRVGFIPPKGDYSLPMEKWVFAFDQDVLPKWADKKKDEARTRKELRKWIAAKVILRGETVTCLYGYCAHNLGTVSKNAGIVKENFGTVGKNSGIVNRNSGIVNENLNTVSENAGTVDENFGIVDNYFGIVEKNHGTVITYIKLDTAINKNPKSVIIDRSSKKVRVFVGKKELQ